MSDTRQGGERAWAAVSQSALAHNIHVLRERFGRQGRTRIMGIVKADAYGHDVSLIAPLCVRHGIADFGVATMDEGIRLRALLPSHCAIYLLAPTLPEDAPSIVAHALIPLVSDLACGQALSAAALRQNTVASLHLDVDTGIGRSGIAAGDAPCLLSQLDALPNIQVNGLSTHFARADEDAADARQQFAQFTHLAQTLGRRAETLLLHASNSPAALVLPDAEALGMMRPGLLLYGIEPASGMLAEAGLDFRPVLSVFARVLLCRPLPGGATVSYGKTYVVPAGGGIYATIGMGYGDGWPRRLGNGVGHVLIHGMHAPICGRVCMDQFVVDVTRIPGVQAGNTATLIGSSGGECITAAHLAQRIGTTPHEISTCLTARVPRRLSD